MLLRQRRWPKKNSATKVRWCARRRWCPHGSPEAVWSELRDYRAESAILITGHEPLLSRLVAHLLAAPGLRVEMKKAAMVRIDVESFGAAPRGTLRWMITPKLA